MANAMTMATIAAQASSIAAASPAAAAAAAASAAAAAAEPAPHPLLPPPAQLSRPVNAAAPNAANVPDANPLSHVTGHHGPGLGSPISQPPLPPPHHHQPVSGPVTGSAPPSSAPTLPSPSAITSMSQGSVPPPPLPLPPVLPQPSPQQHPPHLPPPPPHHHHHHQQPPPQLLQHQPPPPPQHQTTLPQIRQQALTSAKVPIVEPPGSAMRRTSNGQAPLSFGSPQQDHQHIPKFHEDLSRLTHAIQQSVSEAVRQVVRDNWQKSLLGTEFHQAFCLNAVINHSTGPIIRRAIRDFGGKMVSESKREIIDHFKTPDLDEVADEILAKASDTFLDKAMDKRLATIDARSLINALARNERLGYEDDDVTDVQPMPPGAQPFPPSLMPEARPQQLPSPAQPTLPAPSQLAQPSGPAQLDSRGGARQPAVPNLQCPLCWRKFSSPAPYEYHVKKQLCTKPPPNNSGFPLSCEHCGAGFVTHVGQQYHHANKVCGDHGTAPATPKEAGPIAPSPPVLPSNRSPVLPMPTPMSAPNYGHGASPYVPSPPATQPRQQPIQFTPANSSPVPPSSGSIASDPYAHLTPHTRARLEEDLRQAEELYAPRFKQAEAIADPNERRLKVEGVQNSFSTKQSIIRKKYGVRLRQRRTKAEIDAERARIQSLAGGTPSGKRRRTDNGAGGTPTYTSTPHAVSSAHAAPTPESPTRKPLSVADMNSGPSEPVPVAHPAESTHGTPAAIKSEQTPSRPPITGRSLSSLQRNGYRVSTHTPHDTSARASASPASPREPMPSGLERSVTPVAPTVPMASMAPTAPMGPAEPAERGERAKKSESPAVQRSGSTAEPILLEDESSDSNSDPDEEIPATIPSGRRASGSMQPGRRASATPQKGLAA